MVKWFTALMAISCLFLAGFNAAQGEVADAWIGGIIGFALVVLLTSEVRA